MKAIRPLIQKNRTYSITQISHFMGYTNHASYEVYQQKLANPLSANVSSQHFNQLQTKHVMSVNSLVEQ